MEREDHTLGAFLKKQLQVHGLSLRKFSETAGIDAATISRIINGKRQANLQHLQAFSKCLGVPMSEMLNAAGHGSSVQAAEASDIQKSIESIHYALKSCDVLEEEFSIELVSRELEEFRGLAQTDEGKRRIDEEFEGKLKKIGSTGPFISRLKEWQDTFQRRKGTSSELAVIGSALLYFIIPADVIPDFIFPIGYIDDAIAVQIAMHSMKG